MSKRDKETNPMTFEMVDELFYYLGGEIFWKISPKYNIYVGDRAGGNNGLGYRKVRVKGVKEYEHRVIFMLNHRWCPKFIDHIDGDPSNNRIENLRPATMSQNSMNKKMQVNNKTGARGVHFCNKSKKFIASIQAKRKRIHLGVYDTLDEARYIYDIFSTALHAEYKMPSKKLTLDAIIFKGRSINNTLKSNKIDRDNMTMDLFEGDK